MFFLIMQGNTSSHYQMHQILNDIFSPQDPFLGIPVVYKQELEEKQKKLLIDFLSKSSVDVWLLEMHEFLLLNLKSQRATDIFKPSWR